MPRLPASGAEVALRPPCGIDDLLLAEAVGSAIETGLMLLGRLATEEGEAGGEARDWSDLAITDFEFLLLRLRARRFGQNMALAFACPHCRALAEAGFRIDDFLADVTPRQVAGVTPDPARPGWFKRGAAGFRLPTAGDLAGVADLADPLARLTVLCLDETARRAPHRVHVERAMETMAPQLSRPIAGRCPACGAAVRAGLNVPRLVIAELKRAAGAVHDEIDLIAAAYHWPESTILALPQERRRAYAARIRRGQAQAA